MSAARARRRFMAHERSRRRALLLGLPYRLMTSAHQKAMCRADVGGRRLAWRLPDPPLSKRRSR